MLVGRDREMAVLDAALTQIAAGRGGAYLVAGEPGIGKTRLATELATLATARGARVAWGRCWLVGDAGYTKDPITAQGMSDAFRDAELLATALASTFSGRAPFTAALGAYQAARDAQSLAMYDFTCQIAAMEPPPPELQQLLAAIHGNQPAMDGFCRVNAGITSPAEFFASVGGPA